MLQPYAMREDSARGGKSQLLLEPTFRDGPTRTTIITHFQSELLV